MKPVAYTDLSALRSLDQNSPKSLQAVAKQFESMFVDMMLQAARSATAVLAQGNPFESNETSLHQEMLDHQLAVDMSEHGGIGLAPLLVRQLSKMVGGATEATAGMHVTPFALPARPATAQLRLPTNVAAGTSVDISLAPVPDSTPKGQSAAPLAPLVPFESAEFLPFEFLTSDVMSVVNGNLNKPRMAASPPVQPRVAPAANTSTHAIAVKHQAFDDPVAFVRAVLPAIAKVTAGTGIAPVAVLAQAALETGWGKSVIGDGKGGSSFNLFGVKSGAAWSGKVATVSTLEVRSGLARREQAAFRIYDNVEHAVSDFVAKLQSASRYASALAVAGKPAAYAQAIGKSGYATDPAYAQKLLHVLQSPTLAAALAAVAQEFGDPRAPDAASAANQGAH